MTSSYAERTLVRQVNTPLYACRRGERPRRLRRRRLPHPDRAAPRRVCPACAPTTSSAQVLGALLDRNPAVPPDAVADVVWGAANQAGEDNRNVARMAVLLAGLPLSVPGATVNRLCGSGLDAVNRAAADLALGHGDVAVAGGVEAMSRAPFVLPRPTTGCRGRSSSSTRRSAGGSSTRRCRPSTRSASGMTAEVLAARVRHRPRGAGPLRPREPPPGRRRRGRPAASTASWCRCRSTVPMCRRRGAARRHHPRTAGRR